MTGNFRNNYRKILSTITAVAALALLAGCPVNNSPDTPGPKNPPLVPEPKA